MKLEVEESEEKLREAEMENKYFNSGLTFIFRMEITKAPFFGFDANSMTIYLRTIPVSISRWDLLNVVKKTDGFVSLSLSEPLKNQSFVRYGWISYKDEESCTASKLILDNTTINDFCLAPVHSHSATKQFKV